MVDEYHHIFALEESHRFDGWEKKVTDLLLARKVIGTDGWEESHKRDALRGKKKKPSISSMKRKFMALCLKGKLPISWLSYATGLMSVKEAPEVTPAVKVTDFMLGGESHLLHTCVASYGNQLPRTEFNLTIHKDFKYNNKWNNYTSMNLRNGSSLQTVLNRTVFARILWKSKRTSPQTFWLAWP